MPHISSKAREIFSQVRYPCKDFEYLTVTIGPHLNNEIPQYQLAATKHSLLQILNTYCSDFSGVVELNKQANVHYHLWYVLKDESKSKFFYIALKKAQCRNKQKYNNNLGYFKVSTKNPNKTDDEQRQKAYEYFSKTFQETYNVFKNDTIVLNHNNFVEHLRTKREQEDERHYTSLNIKVDTSTLDIICDSDEIVIKRR